MFQRVLAGVLTVLAVGCAGQPSVAPRASTVTPADSNAIDAVINQYVDGGDLAFLYARIEDRNGNIVYEHSAVNDALLPDTTIDGDTWIRIWSMTKAITISLALDLVEQGELSLDDPVTRFIPEFASLRVAVTESGEPLLGAEDRTAACSDRTVPVAEPMTVRHLIDHEAGFYYALTGYPCIDEPLAAQRVATLADSDALIASLAELPLIQQPGTQYFYGMNTTVLGLVVERVTGRSLNELVKSEFGERLGIAGLRYDLPADATMLPRFSGADGALREARTGELDIFGGDVPDYAPDHALYLGGEGLVGTTAAYADFLRLLLAGGELNGQRLLDTATVADMVAPHTQKDSDWGHNGFNVWVSNGRLGDGSYGRGGLWVVGGYEGTYGWVDPELGLVGVTVTQVHNASARANARHDVIREAFYDQVLPERQGNTYKVYFLGGQSNMDGFGFNRDLPDRLRATTDVMIYRGMPMLDGREKGGAGLWRTLEPGFGLGFASNGYDNWLSDRFGPELGFGHRMAGLNPDADVAIVKYSHGGTALALGASGFGDWHPESPTRNQYDYALRSIREAFAERDIDRDGVADRLVPAGIVWMQGEADAYASAESAAEYQANLTRMMNLLRAALHADDLPVVIGQITDSGDAPDGKVMDWADEVRDAQRRYADSDSCAVLVTATNDLDYLDGDAWHYDSAGFVTLGEAFANAMQALELSCAR
ncbi:MAG: serine hydrolase [Pseudomonadota bacterium]